MSPGAAPWVLVTDSGDGHGRSSVAAVRALARASYRPAVAASGRYALGAASRYCRHRVDVPPAESPRYADAIRSELASRDYLTVLPASDAALLALGSSTEAELVDKVRLAARARSVGIAVPESTLFESEEDLLRAAPDLDYPIVIKPVARRSHLSLPTRRVDRPSDLMAVPRGQGGVIVQPYITAPLLAVCGVIWRGHLVAASHQRYLRTWPAGSGPSCAAWTIAPDLELEKRVVALLGDYEGIFQAQFAGEHLIDLNPRVYGSLPLAVAAGANLVGVLCDLLRGVDRADVRAKPGVFYRWLEGDARTLFAAMRRGKISPGSALRALAPRLGTAHSVESLNDPGPMLMRLRHAFGPAS